VNVGLVPARGGSRTIPRKNIKQLGGRPLLAWVIGAMRASGAVERVVVSTEDDEISVVAREEGAEVLERPAELARDDTPALEVVEHALEELGGVDWLLYVQPTEPFVTPTQIAAALALAEEHDADSAVTVVEVPRTYHPYHVRALQDGLLEFDRPDEHYAHPTRQSDPPRFAFGNLYWVRTEAFRRERALEAGRRVGLPIDPLTALDLNEPSDWALADAVVGAGLVDRW
jgi:CMP-N,N'-diacetyllegionaminic acid synthase